MKRGSLLILALATSGCLAAQDSTLVGKVNVLHHVRSESGSSNVVVWLMPSGREAGALSRLPARLVQKNKQFTPHVLAVTAGTTIEFPNQDPFFHNAFSIYHGRPFDLGLYESGTSRKIVFSKPGVSYIFCNIHPQMSAVVLVMRTPYFAMTGTDGTFQIGNISRGRYRLELWYEFGSDSELASLSRDVEISPGENSLGVITLHSSDSAKDHLNKYGEPYTPERAKY
jgi:plastocyanin